MFSFLRRHSSASSGLSFLRTDMHSHLIPGVDDGSPDLETSVSLIKGLQGLGYEKIITTPHVMQDYYPNTSHVILEGYESLQYALEERGISMDFQVAAEYFLDAALLARIENDEPLLTLSEKKILVEISFIAPPVQLHETLFRLQVKGYEPILAHPERYKFYHSDFSQYESLHEMGCRLQVNLLSLTGYYGKSVQKAAFRLIDKKLPAYLGTDLHHVKHLEALRRLSRDHRLLQRLQEYPWRNSDL